jgi:CelD/BcsL family acetyltransferase involved in cellulose biosynthesis
VAVTPAPHDPSDSGADGHVDLIEVTDLDSLRHSWTALAERSGNVFSTWEWATAWWRHFGQGELFTAACDVGNGDIVAILPLFRVSGEAFLIGRGTSDELGPVCSPDDRMEAARHLRRFLSDHVADWDVFVGDDMPGDTPWDAVLDGHVVHQRSSPVLRADGMGWSDFLASRSGNFRAQVRARERRLYEHYCVTISDTDDPAHLDADLETLFDLHVSRWGPEDARKFAGRQARGFLSDFAAVALQNGWLMLRTLRLDGRPAAALLNFRFGGSEWFYQGGRDPALNRESVGFVLQAHSVRAALDEGLQSYRFLRGAETYKRRFSNEDLGVVTVRVDHP